MKKRKINYFLLLSLFFAIAVLIFIAGCNPKELPIILFFLANPTTIVEGESSTLSWVVTENAAIGIDNGIGAIADDATTITVSPTVTTTYTLMASNSEGTVTASATVYVIPPASLVTITIQPGPAEGKDALVSSYAPNINFGNGEIIDVGNNDVAILRTYLEFDLYSVPDDATVVDAELWLDLYSTPYEEEDIEVILQRINEPWTEAALTWNSQPGYSPEVEASQTLFIGEMGWMIWDIGDLAQGWLNGTISNYGCVLMDTDETSNNTVGYYHSSEFLTDPEKRPKIEITYYIAD